MALISVIRNQVNLGSVPQYERLVRFIAERARADKKTVSWSARVATGSEGRVISFVSRVEGFAELAAREEPDAMIRRLYGEADGAAVLEALGQGVVSTSYTVNTIREDLSTQEVQPGLPLALVTRLRATATGTPGIVELIRKVVEAATKVDDKRRYMVLQTVVGDMRRYSVVQPVADPKQLDKQPPVPELLEQAYGKSEAEKIFAKGSACIEQVETELTSARPDLSNER